MRVKMGWFDRVIYYHYMDFLTGGLVRLRLREAIEDLQFRGYYPPDYVYRARHKAGSGWIVE